MLDKVIKTVGGKTLTFKEIDKERSKKMIIENHYSKKWGSTFGYINVGVFYENKLLGVASFGHLMNPKSYTNIIDGEEGSLIELNRLWIDDSLGKNTETSMLSASFKLIRNNHKHIKAIQSFSDGRLGCGTIYKASNFKYYGFHETLFIESIESGEVVHKVQFENSYKKTGVTHCSEIISNGAKFFRTKTYRYIFPLYKNVKILLDEKPYPDYDKGIEYCDLPDAFSLSTYIRAALLLKYTHKVKILEKYMSVIAKHYPMNEIDEMFLVQENNETIISLSKSYNPLDEW